MPKTSIKNRSKAVLEVVATLIWRGFGLFLFILGGAAGTGRACVGHYGGGDDVERLSGAGRAGPDPCGAA